LKAPGIKPLKLKCDNPLSNFTLTFNLRRYNMAGRLMAAARDAEDGLNASTAAREREGAAAEAAAAAAAAAADAQWLQSEDLTRRLEDTSVRRCRLTLSNPR
jgi:hypothetical protein